MGLEGELPRCCYRTLEFDIPDHYFSDEDCEDHQDHNDTFDYDTQDHSFPDQESESENSDHDCEDTFDYDNQN